MPYSPSRVVRPLICRITIPNTTCWHSILVQAEDKYAVRSGFISVKKTGQGLFPRTEEPSKFNICSYSVLGWFQLLFLKCVSFCVMRRGAGLMGTAFRLVLPTIMQQCTSTRQRSIYTRRNLMDFQVR